MDGCDDSVGRCLNVNLDEVLRSCPVKRAPSKRRLQGAPPAAVEVSLGSLEVRPVSLQGASAWFKAQANAQRRGHQYREVRLGHPYSRGSHLSGHVTDRQTGRQAESYTATSPIAHGGHLVIIW